MLYDLIGFRRWRGRALIVASVLACGLAIVASGSSSSGGTRGGVAAAGTAQAPYTTVPRSTVRSLRIAFPDAIQVLDPLTAGNVTDIAIVNLTAGTLYAFPLSGSSSVVPSLATSGSFGPGDRSFRVTLKPGLVFSDGHPLTSADVVATFHRAKTFKLNTFKAQYDPVLRATAVNSRTVQFAFSRAFPSFKTLLAYPDFAILESSEIAKDGTIPKVPIGAGQYVPAGSLFGKTFVLERNARFGGVKPAAAELRFTVVSDSTSRFQQLANGQFDFAFDLEPSTLKNPPSSVLPQYAPTWGFSYLVENHEAAPLNNTAVRKAISLAIDRRQVSDIAWSGLEKPLGGFFPTPFGSVSKPAAAPDVATARKLLVGTPCADGCTIQMLVPGGFSWAPPTAVVIQHSLSDIGIKLALTTLDDTTIAGKLGTHDFQTTLIYFTDNTPIPEGLPSYCLDPSAGLGACATNWKSPEGTRLVAKARLATTPARRQQVYRQLDALFEKEAPFAVLTNYTYTSGTARSASGLINLTPAGLIEVAPLKK
jgi:peptide/nickel transport system substrate-binding protein